MRSREAGDADKKAEKPEPNRKDSGGTAKDTDEVRQTSTARREHAGIGEEALLEKVLDRANVFAAYKRVKSNGGAAGIDGMTVDELMPFCQKNWTRIRQELLDGQYRPQPVRKVDISKPDGGIRTLGIPTVMDRLIQQALLQVLQPQWDPTFSEDSFGYRPGRSVQQAVVRAQQHIRAGNRWVVDLKTKLREATRSGRGRSLAKTIGDLVPLIRDGSGTTGYRRFAEVSSNWTNGCVIGCGRFCGGSGNVVTLASRNFFDAVLRQNVRGHRLGTAEGLVECGGQSHESGCTHTRAPRHGPAVFRRSAFSPLTL